jgi:hypothetical protein
MRVVKNQIVNITYCVEVYSREFGGWKFEGVVSGCGRNATWDSEAKSKRTAQRWAKELRESDPKRKYSVSPR